MQNISPLKKWIRQIQDFPKKGVLFYDITPLLKEASALKLTLDQLAAPYITTQIDYVAGIESRGFILAPFLAYRLGAGFIPIRKPHKLPAPVLSASHQLEYGESALEIHQDSIPAGSRVLVVDDVLATGGTAAAAVSLLKTLRAHIMGVSFLIELVSLGGREKLQDIKVRALLRDHPDLQ